MKIFAALLLVAAALPAEAEPLSKKAQWIKDKAERADRRAARPPRLEAERVVTLHNVWTNESLPIVPGQPLPQPFDVVTKCHYTNQSIAMDQRLLEVVVRSAKRFGASTVEIVSGFRAPKYQLMLRKKGREVARDSAHPRGHAVDFRIPEVATRQLLKFVRSLKLGGVGYYPESQFVHADVGPVRFWKGH